jgi:hypothetical protein
MAANRRLSSDLIALQVWFDECLRDGTEMTREGAVEFSNQLDLAVRRAEALEDGVQLAANVVEAMAGIESEPESCVKDRPDNVVLFPRAPRRRFPHNGDAA